MIRKYKDEDYDLVASWCIARGLKRPNKSSLSTLGYVVDDRVAGWVYLTDSNMAIIEGIISDPNTIPSNRRLSVKKLCGTLVDTALSLGYTNIVGITNHPSIEKICKEFGFKTGNFRVYVLSEKDEEV